MGKGTVIQASQVKTLYVDETYSSKMLIDQTNSETKNVQINMGIVAPGAKHTDHNHAPSYDEVYLIHKGKAMVRLDGVEHELEPGDVVFIPGGSMHAIANRSDTEELVIFTVWSRLPEPGANPVYDLRLEQWGKSYKTVDEE
ncbi:cupin domain-containing protein [Cohnella rhizosphaerae]|uniref:Cupin domain-containing protein n=1 Tax=Cohnella rhizosphaerae TaxID=1457232 RepID=A0A9X4KRX4_9BACL|nr:cupin domain-containing protein [Cohnella rhizosphaerae]MDG0810021.1 cupin domain-containing protein [Cohnella rhizosphaerae]